MSTNTIHQTATELRTALIAYIEAAYHIGDPGLLQQRRRLLEIPGVIHQEPFLESTPRYLGGTKFADIPGLPTAALAALQILSAPDAQDRRVLHDPPYKHQAEALQHALATPSKNLVITTGTGSGKTESFLMPILGKLAIEASDGTGSFAMSAMRAMVLYPMNALVNDQLTRLRAIFGDKRVVELFKSWSTRRPPRFARYTSRTPYAGQRNADKDRRNLRPFRDFYIGALEACGSDDESTRLEAERLIHELNSRGKWPAKPDLAAWYGADNARWQDASGQFKRCVTLPNDSELVTRDEAQRAAPDLLVTNYSMLEYMLMRPVERTIFDQTRAWLAANPSQQFLVVLDEAHLYRGAAGAEVGLLLRRLRDRLDIPANRFQVICATASFSDNEKAPGFASQLTGTDPRTFKVIKGELLLRDGPRPATPEEALLLAGLNLEAFYSPDRALRAAAIAPVLAHFGITASNEPIEPVLHRALMDFGPLALLVNTTMRQAWSLDKLAESVFPGTTTEIAQRALTHLAALATAARLRPEDPSLLPCRVHTFFRGLRGLWACMDENCTQVPIDERGVLGRLNTQPIETCACGARVLELFTCRLCGTAYARGYCSDPDDPSMIWREPGAELRVSGEASEPLRPVDMLLSSPVVETLARHEFFDLVTGQINPPRPQRVRSVFLPIQPRGRGASADDDDAGDAQAVRELGVFYRCGGCNKTNTLVGSPVQDHETKGDQPFQALVSRQLSLQPPSKDETRFAPLRGRKVLVFSDSRQVAARLAPNLQLFAARDSLRPLLAFGWARLSQIPNLDLRLDDVYCAVLLAAQQLGVRLRPELGAGEHFSDYDWVGEQLASDGFTSDEVVRKICEHLRQGDGPPQALLVDIMTTMRDRALGLEPLALASIVERADQTAKFRDLPDVPGVTETADDRLQLARAWFREWHAAGFWLRAMAPYWYRLHPNRKVRISTLSDKFKRFVDRLPSAAAKKTFTDKWLPKLRDTFTQPIERQFRLEGKLLSLQFGGDWVRCEDCKSVHRPIRLLPVCPDCGRSNVLPIDPSTDEPFRKRKGYYRQSVLDVLGGERKAPLALVAAEHTAQLNSARKDEVFSKAEVNELLFQDVELPAATHGARTSAIDVLSSTTTMEVGIDIGQLSGVALRNMPPARANYQQRAGRAGRRGSAIASVVAFGGSDTHDEHFFSRPAEMIAGDVVDPTLSLNNADIARRHLRAFLFQSYIQARVQAGDPGESNLFSVLGTVAGFLRPGSRLNRHDFETWLREHASTLRQRAERWLPTELSEDDRAELLAKMLDECLVALDEAIGSVGSGEEQGGDAEQDGEGPEVQAEVDDAVPTSMSGAQNLLDALLYKGILPRYAFPTDVSTFHVFDNAQSTVIRPLFEFAPSQGTPVALSQYAPGKQVWIAGKCYTSGAIYSPMLRDKDANWDDRQLQVECDRCGYTERAPLGGALTVGERIDCPACRGGETLGPAHYWLRPVGFAHPQEQPALVSPEEIPETTYATRAKLIMNSSDALPWMRVTERVRVYQDHKHLLVSNNGPRRRGYNYCRKCGRIEASVSSTGALNTPHPKPYPDPGRQTCRGGLVAHDVVLGTDFITDVALFSLKVDDPIRLRPADTITRVGLRTLCEALTRAAAERLQIEPGELMAEYRPAVTPSGCDGLEAEIFLYDTLPGGAGFSQQAAQLGPELFIEARRIMDECPEHCDVSCYRCLRNFRNRLDHGLLDRHVGVALVDYLLSDAIPPFNAQRLENSIGQLVADMERQVQPGTSVTAIAAVVDEEGCRYAPAIHVITRAGEPGLVYVGNPLCETEPVRDILVNGRHTRCVQVSELMVRRSLPEASQQVWRELGGG